jgi:acyl-CoA thioester hydrolase
MYVAETSLRVRYAETDQMGYVYYGNYALYYEIGRTEALRSLGFSYRQMEAEMGIMMPVRDLQVQFKAPALYDDALRIEVRIPELPQTRMGFLYRIYNEAGKLLNEGSTTLVFVNKASGRPCRAPEALRKVLEPYY